MKKTITPATGVPLRFLNRFGEQILGTLCGFDRLRLRGTLRHLFQPSVMEAYLNACGVLIKDFGTFAHKLSTRVREANVQLAQRLGRAFEYLRSSQRSKEQIAKEIARHDKIEHGLIVILSALEPCQSFSVRGQRQSKEIHLVLETRKCLFFYHYFIHPLFGFMHARVQSWFPFTIDFCLNGREWLARQMDRAGMGYHRRENCFVAIADWQRAQQLLERQLQIDWPKKLSAIVDRVHPLHREICAPIGQQYYWTASATEYATDVAFGDANQLAALYPRFIQHGISSFCSPEVMRFLGRWVPTTTGRVYRQFDGEVISDIKHRPEGVRIKHSLNGNSIKLYDKQGSVLRVETTINRTEQFKVFRRREGQRHGPCSWRMLRRGLADLPRRAQVSRAANERYLDALASTTGSTPLAKLVAKVCSPVMHQRQRYRALRPWSAEDALLCQTLAEGKFAINGFRNRDLRSSLNRFASKKLSTQALTRRLRLLRAHGIIRKLPKTHRYLLTPSGRQMLTALRAAHCADVDHLTAIAA
jgi:hypothetical protein